MNFITKSTYDRKKKHTLHKPLLRALFQFERFFFGKNIKEQKNNIQRPY